MGNLRRAFAASAFCLLLAAPASAGPGELHESVPVASGGTLHVELDRGRVDVVAHDAPEVRIEALARGLGASSVHFALRSEGDDLVLTGRAEDWLAFMRSGPSVRVRAWIPREFGVEVHTRVEPDPYGMRNSGL